MGIKHKIGRLVNRVSPDIYESISWKFSYLRYLQRKSTRENKYEEKLEEQYKKMFGKSMSFENPVTYSEKIQWLKLYDKNPLRTKLTDKVYVRDWIKDKIGETYLIPIYGVYDKFDDIDFGVLPEKFVIKTNHSSGWNIVCTDKSNFDIKKARKKINKWMKVDYAFWGEYEIHYSDISPRIIVEQFVNDKNGELNDYKFLCFNGECKYVWVDVDRYTDHKRNVYDLQWNLQPWNQSRYGNASRVIDKPANFEEMLSVANTLSQGFTQVRVDLYNVDGKIYFGEMTFTSCSGLEGIWPQEYEYVLGEELQLPLGDRSSAKR